jgi:hypothetical protein
MGVTSQEWAISVIVNLFASYIRCALQIRAGVILGVLPPFGLRAALPVGIEPRPRFRERLKIRPVDVPRAGTVVSSVEGRSTGEVIPLSDDLSGVRVTARPQNR